MQTKTFLAVTLAALVATPPLPAGREKKDPQAALFTKKLSKEQKAIHALRRLTFGPRPGEVERVKAMGVEKWVEQQLHPQRIAENPALEAKLKPLDSLRMTSEQIVEHYPPPQVIQAMASGRQPFPADPQQRKLLERAVERLKRQRERREPPRPGEVMEQLSAALTPDQLRILRNGTPEERMQMLSALPDERRDQVMDILPPNARRDVMERGSSELRRKVLYSTQPQQVIAHDLVEGKLYRAVYSNRQLEEVLTDFWFNHFNVYMDKGADRLLITSYERDAIRPHVLGKFKDLVRATAEHPAMLFYLDNWQSVDPEAAKRGRAGVAARRGLNENYARELLELHTMGVDGGYTQKDVMEVARCFTGWTIRNPQRGGGFLFDERMHDAREKTVLGVTIPAGRGVEDGLQVIDILLKHPSTAQYVSRRLAERFVADNPPASLVDRMAQTFTRTEGDIREVMRTMLRSKEFWSQGAYRAKMKSPLEMVASAVRALDADVVFSAGLGLKIAELGQPLYRKQEPTGYSNANEEWINSTALVARMNFAQALTANQLPGVKVDLARVVKANPADPQKVAKALLMADASEQTRAAIAAASQPTQAAGLIIGSPDFQRR